MMRRCGMRCWLLLVVIGSLSQIDAADEYQNEGFSRETDSLGMLWDFDRGVAGAIDDGTNDLFDGGLRSFVEEGANTQAMTPFNQYYGRRNTSGSVRRHTKTREWVVDIPSSSLEVQRRVFLDRAGFLRYVEVIKNPSSQAMPVQVHIFSDTGTSVQSVTDDQGRPVSAGPLADDVRGFVLTQNRRNDLLWYVGEKSDQVQVFMQYQGTYHMLSYAFTVEAGATAAITYTVGQRNTGSGINEAFLDYASDLEFYQDLPREVRQVLLNGPSFGMGSGAVYSLEELGLNGHAEQAVLGQGDTTRLLGAMDWRLARIRTPYGEHSMAADQVAGLIGRANDPRRQIVFLRDGQILSGDLSIEGFAFKHSSGFTMVDQEQMIDRLLAPGVNVDSHGISGWSVALIDGNHLRLKPPQSEDRIQLRSPWGDVNVSLAGIQSLTRPAEDELLAWHLLSKDGQQVRVYPMQTTISIDSELFGPLEIPLASVVSLLAPRSSSFDGEDVDSAKPSPQAGTAVITMVDGARLVGDVMVQDLQLLDRQRHAISIPMQQVTRIEARAGRTTVFLNDGSQVSGWWDRSHLPLSSRNREVAIPINAVSLIELQAPALSPAERAVVLDLVRSLGAVDWVEREEATRALRDKGIAIHNLLQQQLARSEDPEIQHRLTLILEGE